LHTIVDDTLDNYGFARCGKAGPVILIRKSLQSVISQISKIQNNRIIGIDVRVGCSKPLYIFCLYMPSDSDVNSYNETLCDVQSIFSHYCKPGTVLFTADFNAQIDSDTRLPFPQPKVEKLLSALTL